MMPLLTTVGITNIGSTFYLCIVLHSVRRVRGLLLDPVKTCTNVYRRSRSCSDRPRPCTHEGS
jgi:hypothetical protein